MMTAGSVLVTGAAGLLGRHLVGSAPDDVVVHRTWRATPPPPTPHTTDHRVDLADAEAVTSLVTRVGPAVVLHTAYDPREHQAGIVDATANVAAAAAAVGASVVHLSSDVVFDGEHPPFAEDDALCPITAYGVAKAKAEAAVREAVPDAAVVRTSLLCDADPPDPRTQWILDALVAGEPIDLFTDEIRLPARVDDLAARIWSLAGRPRDERSGPWHLVGPEPLSRHEIGLRVATWASLDPGPLRRASSAGLRPPRPRDLRLAVSRLDTPTTPNRPIDTLFASP